MKRKLWTWMAVAAALTAAGMAHAQEMGHRRAQGMRGDRTQFVPLSPQQAEPLPREAQRQEPQPPGRMSPEERRQLRRDINEAGRELYRHPQQRPSP